MAGCVVAGTLLFVLLIGATYSFTLKKGSQDDGSDDGTGSGGVQEVIYSKPGDFRGADASSFSGAAPVYSGFASSYPMGSNQYNLGPAASQDANWIVSPFGLAGDESATSSLGHGPHSHSSAQGGASSQYQSGELSHMQNTFEHGNYDTETETQGLSGQPGVFLPDGSLPQIPEMMANSISGLSLPYYPGYYYNPYPYWDMMFFTGRHPPGTVSHFSSDFEQGRDYYHDAHYNKYHSVDSTGPDDQTGQQVKIFPWPVKKMQQGGANTQA